MIIENNMEVIVIDYNNKPEEYNEFMRAIRNVENFFRIQCYDDENEIDNDYNYYYDSHSDSVSEYDSGNGSDIEYEYENGSDIENNFNISWRLYNPDDFISDPDLEAEPDEGIQENLDNE